MPPLNYDLDIQIFNGFFVRCRKDIVKFGHDWCGIVARKLFTNKHTNATIAFQAGVSQQLIFIPVNLFEPFTNNISPSLNIDTVAVKKINHLQGKLLQRNGSVFYKSEMIRSLA